MTIYTLSRVSQGIFIQLFLYGQGLSRFHFHHIYRYIRHSFAITCANRPVVWHVAPRVVSARMVYMAHGFVRVRKRMYFWSSVCADSRFAGSSFEVCAKRSNLYNRLHIRIVINVWCYSPSWAWQSYSGIWKHLILVFFVSWRV